MNIKEKKIKAIQNQGQVKIIRKYAYNDEDSPLISMQKEIFNKLVDQRLEVNSGDLRNRYKVNTADAKFDEFDNAFNLLDKMRDGKKSLVNAKNDQAKHKSNLSEIKEETRKA